MSNPIDFNQKKATKNGEVTVTAALEDIAANIDDIDKIVIVMRCKDGLLKASWNTNETLNVLGLLEAGKTIVFSEMEDA